MGLLTDPSTDQGKFLKVLLKYYPKLCGLLYVAGIVWFLTLAYPPMNQETYFSENALLPGLVKSEFRDGNIAKQYYEELLDEQKKYDDGIPYPWLMAKFRQIGLEAYTHNFTLNHPLGKSLKYTGKNIYGILRAARASSTEALVISAPYRPPLSVHLPTTASIAIMLAFAKFANKEKYWSKDIIFLVTEHEQLGMQAWLEAYHSVSCGKENVLLSGDLKGRAGAIQAAVNLEFHDPNLGKIDLKIEGLNGQLPNLDFFNLVSRICLKEGIEQTFKNRKSKKLKSTYLQWKTSMKTLMSMVSTQATGVPNGNHGLFYRFGIQAITMEGFATKTSIPSTFLNTGRLLEGIFRSLNNLLERFHQSFFFYLLPSSNRFISISLYIPAVCLIVATLFIKAFAKWSEIDKNPLNEQYKEINIENSKSDPDLGSGKKPPKFSDEKWNEMYQEELNKKYKFQKSDLQLGNIGLIFILAHCIGFVSKSLPYFASHIGVEYNYKTESSIYISFITLSAILCVLPLVIKKPPFKSIIVLNIVALLELAICIICIVMYNISLALFLAVIYIPFALLINPTNCRLCKNVQKALWLLVQPFVLLNIIIIVYCFFMFPGENLNATFKRGIGASQQALVFGFVDSEIYGNWLFNVGTNILLSNWLIFWFITFAKGEADSETKEKKE